MEFWIILLALAIDLMVGEPSRIPHPVVLLGRAISYLDRSMNKGEQRRGKGILALGFLVMIAGALGWLIQSLIGQFLLGQWLLAFIASLLIAARSLYDHVFNVKQALLNADIVSARREIAKICGRDPESLDEAGISRASIESLAESLCDGVVAPIFWGLIFGLPGMLVYKAVNTADSMIGHKTETYREFGWAAARFDDVLNWIPARLSAFFITVSGFRNLRDLPKTWRRIQTEAKKHESPNAGWPESALALRLHLALGGPRSYDGQQTNDQWLNEGARRDATAVDIGQALGLFREIWALIAGAILALAIIFH